MQWELQGAQLGMLHGDRDDNQKPLKTIEKLGRCNNAGAGHHLVKALIVEMGYVSDTNYKEKLADEIAHHDKALEFRLRSF